MKTRKHQKLFAFIFTFIILAGEIFAAVPVNAASGYCTYCDGTGDCNSCYGIGDCNECYGYGDDDCANCFNGDCVNCAGEGSIPQYSMGNIKERKCISCRGSGNCSRCKGAGRIKCSHCSGSGDCSTCRGDADCNYCGGTGIGSGTSSSAAAEKPSTSNSQQTNNQYLEIDKTSLTLKVGESYSFSVRGKTDDGKAYAVYDKNYLRESTDGSFTYKAIKAGTTTIEFRSTDDTVKTTCKVTITGSSGNAGSSTNNSIVTGKSSSDDKEDTKNTLRVNIDGEDQVFYLERAVVSVINIYVYYTALNPRGEERYTIEFNFDKNLTEGTYSIMDRDSASDAAVTFNKAGSYTFYRSQRSRGKGKTTTGSFTIDSVNDDWTTYEGSFSVTLVPSDNSDSVTIEDAEFNFTIGETHSKLA